MEKSNKTTVAGILNIITGVIELIWAMCLLIGFAITSGAFAIRGGIGYIPDFVPGLILGLAIISIIIAAFIFVGGVYSLIRKRWAWALAGSIIGIFVFFPLGIASTVLVAQSKIEFQD